MNQINMRAVTAAGHLPQGPPYDRAMTPDAVADEILRGAKDRH
jgi:hypothetical protein